MQLDLKKDEPNLNVTGQDGEPAISTSSISTTVVVDNGGTVMIGGIYKYNDGDAFQKLPWLADIPLVGWLFKYKETTVERREVIFFITPRIISDKMRVE